MNRLSFGDAGCLQNGWKIEVTLRGASGSNANCFGCQHDVGRTGIGFRVNRYWLDAELTECPHNTDSNNAAIGDQDSTEHYLPVSQMSKWTGVGL